MLLSDLFDRLATGELSQHKYGKTGAILVGDHPALINQLNIALTNLYAYFPLREKEVIIQQHETITEYQLDTKYAQSNIDSVEPIKYILDSVNPFLDDVLRIEAVFDGEGTEVPLNNATRTDSWFTPSWDSLQIPAPVDGNVAAIVYRAKHTKIASDADVSTEVLIPTCLEEALQAYIASRCFVSLGNQASASLASYYTNRYNEQIQWVERNNLLQSSTGDSNIKLSLKGFI